MNFGGTVDKKDDELSRHTEQEPQPKGVNIGLCVCEKQGESWGSDEDQE